MKNRAHFLQDGTNSAYVGSWHTIKNRLKKRLLPKTRLQLKMLIRPSWKFPVSLYLRSEN